MLLIVSFLIMTVLNETMGVSFIIPAAQCDLNMSTSDKGLLSSMTFFGKLFNNLYSLSGNCFSHALNKSLVIMSR